MISTDDKTLMPANMNKCLSAMKKKKKKGC
jgi:hypothetical protein